MQVVVHYIKEREQTNDYEEKKLILNDSNMHSIFAPGHHAGILTELDYLQELNPNGKFIYDNSNPLPALTEWKGRSVIVKVYNYGGAQHKIYFDYKIDSRGIKIPTRPIGVSY